VGTPTGPKHRCWREGNIEKEKNQNKVQEGGKRERKSKAGEDMALLGFKEPWLCLLSTPDFHFDPNSFTYHTA